MMDIPLCKDDVINAGLYPGLRPESGVLAGIPAASVDPRP